VSNPFYTLKDGKFATRPNPEFHAPRRVRAAAADRFPDYFPGVKSACQARVVG
jgi:hypothetical protein